MRVQPRTSRAARPFCPPLSLLCVLIVTGPSVGSTRYRNAMTRWVLPALSLAAHWMTMLSARISFVELRTKNAGPCLPMLVAPSTPPSTSYKNQVQFLFLTLDPHHSQASKFDELLSHQSSLHTITTSTNTPTTITMGPCTCSGPSTCNCGPGCKCTSCGVSC